MLRCGDLGQERQVGYKQKTVAEAERPRKRQFGITAVKTRLNNRTQRNENECRGNG
jgi:hypothetical protein